MKYVKFGKTDLSVSEIGFGAWAIGGEKWGNDISDDNSIASLEKAYDLGINFYDTCDAYGSGHSEELIGKVFKDRRSKVVIATKAGTNFRIPERSKNFGRKYLLDSLDESLKRLGTDYVDLFQLHVPGTQDIERGEIFETLDYIKKQGKSRYVGLAMWYNPDDIILALDKADFDVLQCPFNLLNQVNKKAVRLAGQKGVAVLTSEPLASGILTGKYSSATPFAKDDHRAGIWTKEKLGEIEPKLEYIRKNVKSPFTNMMELALAYNLSFKEINVVIPGAKKPSQVEGNVTASGLTIPADVLREFDKF